MVHLTKGMPVNATDEFEFLLEDDATVASEKI